jgi:hypothetical protein
VKKKSANIGFRSGDAGRSTNGKLTWWVLILICGFLAAAIAVPTLGKGILSGSLVLAVTIVGYFLGKKLLGG